MTDEVDDGSGVIEDPIGRRTAPQGPYSGRDVIRGAVIATLGILLTVVVPLLLA